MSPTRTLPQSPGLGSRASALSRGTGGCGGCGGGLAPKGLLFSPGDAPGDAAGDDAPGDAPGRLSPQLRAVEAKPPAINTHRGMKDNTALYNTVPDPVERSFLCTSAPVSFGDLFHMGYCILCSCSSPACLLPVRCAWVSKGLQSSLWDRWTDLLKRVCALPFEQVLT